MKNPAEKISDSEAEMLRIILFSTLVMLIGCAARLDSKIAYSLDAQYKFVLDETLVAGVGEEIASSRPINKVNLYLVFDNTYTSEITHRDKTLTVVAPAGHYEFVGTDVSGRYFESADGEVTVNNKALPGGLYIPNFENIPASIYWQSNFSIKDYPQVKVHHSYLSEHPIQTDEVINLEKIPNEYYSNGFISTLSYMGVSGDEIRFVYREYFNGMARAAFTQEVVMDYDPGRKYAYKNAKFIVEKADSVEIVFTLLSPL